MTGSAIVATRAADALFYDQARVVIYVVRFRYDRGGHGVVLPLQLAALLVKPCPGRGPASRANSR